MEAPKWDKVNGEVHTLKKSELEYNLTDTEEFLNSMIAQGWRPVQVRRGKHFSFVPCEPGSYICRTAISVKKNGNFDKVKAANLCNLLVSDGAIIVDQVSPWAAQMGVIAIRPVSLGAFEMATDIDSRIAEYEARKKYHQTMSMTYYMSGFIFVILAVSMGLTLDMSFGGLGMGVVAFAFIVVGYYYGLPIKRHDEVLAQLKAERNIREA